MTDFDNNFDTIDEIQYIPEDAIGKIDCLLNRYIQTERLTQTDRDIHRQTEILRRENLSRVCKKLFERQPDITFHSYESNLNENGSYI